MITSGDLAMPTAQLLLYSGAKNPSRELNANQVTALTHMVERLSKVVPQPTSALGPGGASVTWDAGGPFAGLLVRDGVVTLYRRDRAEPEYRLDDVGIEGFLMHCLAEARSQVRLASAGRG